MFCVCPDFVQIFRIDYSLVLAEGFIRRVSRTPASANLDRSGPLAQRVDALRIKDRDFSQMHIALEIEDGILKHVDGVHQLLAYVLFEKTQEIRAYVAGVMPAS